MAQTKVQIWMLQKLATRMLQVQMMQPKVLK
jgi:hypothetical protein